MSDGVLSVSDCVGLLLLFLLLFLLLHQRKRNPQAIMGTAKKGRKRRNIKLVICIEEDSPRFCPGNQGMVGLGYCRQLGRIFAQGTVGQILGICVKKFFSEIKIVHIRISEKGVVIG